LGTPGPPGAAVRVFMINWLSLLSNSAWILGLAVILAAMSYVYWESTQAKRPFREGLGSPAFLMPFYGGLMLIGLGLLGTGESALEYVLAALLVAGSAFAFVRNYQSRAEDRRSS
jgi:hypothetical protein